MKWYEAMRCNQIKYSFVCSITKLPGLGFICETCKYRKHQNVSYDTSAAMVRPCSLFRGEKCWEAHILYFQNATMVSVVFRGVLKRQINTRYGTYNGEARLRSGLNENNSSITWLSTSKLKANYRIYLSLRFNVEPTIDILLNWQWPKCHSNSSNLKVYK